MRSLIAGLLGGIAMFIWSSIAHVATPLGTTGINMIKDTAALNDTVATAVGHRDGLYVFDKATKGSTVGETGFLVFNSNAPTAMVPANLIVEFITEVIESVIAAWLLAQTALVGFGARVGFVTMVGVVASIATNVPYWNWYRFPTSFTIAAIIITLVAYIVAGIAIALVLRPRTTA
jgi:hypothetical protein